MRLCFLFALIPLLASCAGPTGDIPRFVDVDSGRVLSSAQPTPAGIAELGRRGVRAIVKLNADKLEEEKAAAAAAGIKLFYVPEPGLTAPDPGTADYIQALIRDPMNQPVLFHCLQGQDRTGLVRAIYRVEAEHWTPAAAHKEWRDLGHSPLLFGMDQYFEKREGEK